MKFQHLYSIFLISKHINLLCNITKPKWRSETTINNEAIFRKAKRVGKPKTKLIQWT
jgi:hypothetical protein